MTGLGWGDAVVLTVLAVGLVVVISRAIWPHLPASVKTKTTYRPWRDRDSAALAAQYPPLEERPRTTRTAIVNMIIGLHPNPILKPDQSMEGWLASEVAKVEMAEALGRAIHQAKVIGGPWGPPCGRVKSGITNPTRNEHFEMVPFGYDSGEFECECPQMGGHLVDLMSADAEATSALLHTPNLARA